MIRRPHRLTDLKMILRRETFIRLIAYRAWNYKQVILWFSIKAR